MIRKKCRYCNNLNDGNAKYCTVCGASLLDAETVEVIDGPTETKEEPNPANTTYSYNSRNSDFERNLDKTMTSGNMLAIASIICAFFFPIVGLIVGILALGQKPDESMKKIAKAAIIISIVFMAFVFLFGLTVFILSMSDVFF